MSTDDGENEASLQLLKSYPGTLLVPELVSPNIETRLGWEQKRASSAISARNFTTAPVLLGDWMRIAELVARYHDLPLGKVDACRCVSRLVMSISRQSW